MKAIIRKKFGVELGDVEIRQFGVQSVVYGILGLQKAWENGQLCTQNHVSDLGGVEKNCFLKVKG